MLKHIVKRKETLIRRKNDENEIREIKFKRNEENNQLEIKQALASTLDYEENFYKWFEKDKRSLTYN